MRTLVLLLLIGSGCRSDSILTEQDERTAQVLAALHLAEARALRVGDVSGSVRDSLLSLHGFSRISFEQHMEALSHDLERYRLVYEAVEKNLALLPDATARPAQ